MNGMGGMNGMREGGGRGGRAFFQWLEKLAVGAVLACGGMAWAGEGGGGGAVDAGGRLVGELLGEEDWAGTRREGLRWLGAHGEGAAGWDEVRYAVAMARLGEGDREGGLKGLAEVWKDEGAARGVRSRAGWASWRAGWDGQGENAEALEALKTALKTAEEAEDFWLAGCALHFYAKKNPAALEGEEGLAMVVATSREIWPTAVWKACNPRTNGMKGGGGVGNVLKWPGRLVTLFYREGIRPAIGGRCGLEPSCSEYFLQATEKRGLVGVAMGADRLIREPSVIAAGEETVAGADGGVRVRDPVEWHWGGE